MDTQEKMKLVDDILLNISNELGQLTKYGVLSVEDSLAIIQTLNGKQYEWMTKTFFIIDILEYMTDN